MLVHIRMCYIRLCQVIFGYEKLGQIMTCLVTLGPVRLSYGLLCQVSSG